MSAISLTMAIQCLEVFVNKNIAVFLHGPPGIGKSQGVHQLAKKMKRNLIDMRLSLRDPVDLRGVPFIDKETKTTKWMQPDELPREDRDGKFGYLFLDEYNAGTSQAVQTAAMNLVLDRKLGEYRLPPGWLPIAAGNRLIDKAAAQRMGTALKNRFAYLEVDVNVESFLNYAASINMHYMVRGFIRWRPALLHQMPKADENSFPTPRAWETVSKLADEPEEIRQTLVAAIVGDGPASEFEGFCRIFARLPSLVTILRDPRRATVPDDSEPSVFFAISSALAQKADKDNFANITAYLTRLPKEFEISTVTDAIKRQPDLKKTKAYVDWCLKNQEIVL